MGIPHNHNVNPTQGSNFNERSVQTNDGSSRSHMNCQRM